MGFVNQIPGIFDKESKNTVAFTKTGAGTATIKAGTIIDVHGVIFKIVTGTTIVMPALAAGTDYAIYACTDGAIRADANASAPTGWTTDNSRKIGGFHYSPGGHSGSPGGGNSTPSINEYSLWDIKFKPQCTDPRGMALVAGNFWSDIYLTGVDHYTNGTSKYNVTIADGLSPPKIPAFFGGNGTTAYSTLTWWEACDVAIANGKRIPTYSEFAALAYGTTEASSCGSDPAVTAWQAAYASKWGCNQVSGVMYQWGDEFGGGTAAAAYVANTNGRGSTYQLENAVIFGGNWNSGAYPGSRSSDWGDSPTF